ncbi:RHH-type rel operon transcriptional repressor/antitoxin RelB [Hoeflea marina]|uniref:Relaxosome protein TraY n=1 Tax=Hoeflea marina TaxID=274592 RepID=A0A317PDW8_9HYPH|nr:DUF6290 family protein [Hoeflea marina]PWV95282.1 RHH-type rel operon transcriptional repressor/antitoxin RelB [Hoeflea marina]
MLALRLPPDLERRLTELAARTGRTKSFYARQALIEYIEDMEDRYLAEQRLAEDDGIRIPLAEVLRDQRSGLREAASGKAAKA